MYVLNLLHINKMSDLDLLDFKTDKEEIKAWEDFGNK